MQAFDDFKNAVGEQPFYLVLPTDKIGSEHWLAALLWPQLREMNLVEIVDKYYPFSMDQRYRLLILDDAIYSGHHIIGTIDELTYKLAGEWNISQSEVAAHFKVDVVTPFINMNGASEMNRFATGMNISITIYSVYQLLPLSAYINLQDYYPDEYLFTQKFGSDILDSPPVYFDHKVAGYMSTFPGIYLEGRVPDKTNLGPLLKELPSRQKIEELASMVES